MFSELEEINRRPALYERCDTSDLWTDPHVAQQMLRFHLDPDKDLSSRNHAFIERSVEWMASRFNLGPGSRVCDLGCGPGLYANRLAARGVTVMGVDFSASSIAHARRSARDQGLAVEYVCANYLDFATDQRFDLVTMIFCDFCALSPKQRGKLTGKFTELLASGGALLLDVHTLEQYGQMQETAEYQAHPEGGFWAPGPHFVFQNSFKYEPEMVFLDKYAIIEPGRGRRVYNWLQFYDQASLAAELVQGGVEIIESYANVAGDALEAGSLDMAVVARTA